MNFSCLRKSSPQILSDLRGVIILSGKTVFNITNLLSSGLYRRHWNLTNSAYARGLTRYNRHTAGGELHPAPKTAIILCFHCSIIICICQVANQIFYILLIFNIISAALIPSTAADIIPPAYPAPSPHG